MNKTPIRCYVYQPIGPDLSPDPRIFAVGGTGSEPYKGQYFTLADAVKFAEVINAFGQFESCCECGEQYPRADLLRDGEIFCANCRNEPKWFGVIRPAKGG